MAKIMQAFDALSRAKGVNSGLDALVGLLMALQNGGPKISDIAELLWAIHDQMNDHLADIERCLDD